MVDTTSIETEAEAIHLLEKALRLGDRPSAEQVLDHAEDNQWASVAESARTYLEHHLNCPAKRIELTDHSQYLRPGDPGYGVTTIHCLDCGAHRGHDGTGLPVLSADAPRRTDDLMRPAIKTRTRKATR
ncbi:hypothetical protein AB0N73_04080 [Microbacterium sp. NPDC089189]|uniref:hypothetical protein n=1 Tax=Microbacterium sp. NPDC089189 TaxID=3154972 RepID=UPI00341CE8F7